MIHVGIDTNENCPIRLGGLWTHTCTYRLRNSYYGTQSKSHAASPARSACTLDQISNNYPYASGHFKRILLRPKDNNANHLYQAIAVK